MFCTNCGNKVADDALFCTSCGQKLTKVEEKPAVEEVSAEKIEEVAAEPVTENEPVAEEPIAQEPVVEQAEEKAENQAEEKTESAKEAPTVEIKNIIQQESKPTPRPVYPLPDKRSWWKCILLGLITFGIYNFVIQVKMTEEINIVASRYDGERTTHFSFVSLLSVITLGIYPFVWWHGFCNRLGREVLRRGYDYRFSAATFWLWNVLGSLILIGPIIYTHKLTKTMNLINRSYNYYG